MAINLSGRNFTKLLDYKPDEINYLLELSKNLKDMQRAGIAHKHLAGKKIVLIFEKTSTRTRCAFETAAMDLGMGVTYLDPLGSQIGKKESIKDTARVLGRMYDGIEYRGFGQDIVETLAKYAGVPVWNGLTDEFHPTQMLADLLTIQEKLGSLKGRKLVFMGDARNNVGNSLMVACAKMGMHFCACAPAQLFPEEALVEKAKEIAAHTEGSITLESDPAKGPLSADVLYTDVWVSMGEPESVWEQRIELLQPYRIDENAMKLAGPKAIFMHCLPSFHDTETAVGKDIFDKFGLSEMEVTNEVFESQASVVFDQAENRMHTIKAIMYATLK